MRISRLTLCILFGVAMCVAAGNVLAQERSTSTVNRGQSNVTTQVERAEVVYVSGNDLVVKMENGEVRHLTVPDNVTATVDGKQLTVHDLKPGMKLQRTITTTTTPTTVTTVKTATGRVVQVIAPLNVILSFPDGSPNKQYKIPKDQVFIIDGEKKTVFDLRPGMTITANVVTEKPEVETSVQRTVTGTAPPPPRPVTPPPQQVLLIEVPVAVPVPVPVAAATPARAPATPPPGPPEPAPTQLPKTGSPLPLIGLLGLLMVGTSMGLRFFDRR